MPPKIKFKALSFWVILKPGQTYYSQNGEDIVLGSIFKGIKNGFYVDIGAHHPKRYSNTLKLYKNGWTGLNVDANPLSIEEFKKYRKRDENILAGIGASAEILTYHMFADPAVNTFSVQDAEKWKKSKWNTYLGHRDIKAVSLNSLLDKYVTKNTKIDYLNIDIEGLDLQVIKTLNWEKYSPTVISIEDHSFSVANTDASELYKYLSGKNYVLHSYLNFSLIFVQTT